MSIIEQAKQAIERTKIKPICWEVIFFDADQAERMDWCEATDEDTAKKIVSKKWKGARIIHVRKSKYTLEEIESLA